MSHGQRAKAVTRRGFLRRAAGAVLVGGAALEGGGGFAQEAGAARVVYRRLGRTNLKISHVVGAWDWNEWIYGAAVEAGINYWHKIAGWREIPEPIRKLDREAWYCDVVIDCFDEEGAYVQFEWARKHLGLQYIDAFKLHSIHETAADVKNKTGFLRAFERLKAEGKVKHLAAAQHGGETAAICSAMIESGHFDHLQPAVGIVPNKAMLDMLRLAQKHDVGIIAKKVMGAVGRAQKERQIRAIVEKHLGKEGKWGAAVIKTVLAFPGVTAVTPRTANFQQLVDNLSTDGLQPTAREAAAVDVLRRFARAEQCSYCGQCLAGCPQRVAISDTLRYATYHSVYGSPHRARTLYAALPPSRRANRCGDCGACEAACPQGLRVRQKLREAHAALV
ncbi:MAG: aldo/keto reductase [Armatimonadota bacterium]